MPLHSLPLFGASLNFLNPEPRRSMKKLLATMAVLTFSAFANEFAQEGETNVGDLKDQIDGINETLADLKNTVDALKKIKLRLYLGPIEDGPIIDVGLELIRVSRNLERMVDLETKIAEEVIHDAGRADQTPESHA